jgi:uncharacterized protein (TIGR00730 family)
MLLAMARLNSLCVFCGSNAGVRPSYGEAAETLGRLLAARGVTLVFGGGKVGLMGKIADAVLAGGGKAIGVIPHALVQKEIAHSGLTELRVVDSMHERKALMAELSDGFVAMPGGFGTLDEFCEILIWAQLGIQRKPCGILNVDGYFDSLLNLFDHGVQEGFLHPTHRQMVIHDNDPESLLHRLLNFEVPQVSKWLNRSET